MPGVEGQWDFYPNLRLKMKHTLSACGTFYAKSHRYKKYATTTIMSQITNAKAKQCSLHSVAAPRGGGGSRDTCPVPAVSRQLAGRWEAETTAAS